MVAVAVCEEETCTTCLANRSCLRGKEPQKPEEGAEEKKQEPIRCGMRCKDGSYCKTLTARHHCKRHICRVEFCTDRCIEDCETTDPPRYVCQRHAGEEVAESARLHRAELLAKEIKEKGEWRCRVWAKLRNVRERLFKCGRLETVF